MMYSKSELERRISELTYIENDFERCISEFHLENGLTEEIKNGGYSVLCNVAFAYGRLAYISRFDREDWNQYEKYLHLARATYKVMKYKFHHSLKHVKNEADLYFFIVINLAELTESDQELYVDAKSLYQFYLEKKPQPSPATRERYEALIAAWGHDCQD